ncbi:MAG: hypothetical protein HFF98_11830 [Oscillibacter sp.]|jgi:hypothetical protein|nr:hypothetical protein [Oscillibacter sp.]
MAIDKSHPMYQEYIGKCKELAKRGQEEAAKVPYSGGQNGPLGEVYRKYLHELNALKREYRSLFSEDTGAWAKR